jgi:hypothetical protein
MTGMDDLDAFVGVWQMSASLPVDGDPPHAETSFEWLTGRRFLIQRWHVDHPAAPDGIAIIGPGESESRYRQHYFDSRGVERIYEMTLADGVWKLWRDAPLPDFSQRFSGTFDPSGESIVGAWEISHGGAPWEHDFDLTYSRVAP